MITGFVEDMPRSGAAASFTGPIACLPEKQGNSCGKLSTAAPGLLGLSHWRCVKLWLCLCVQVGGAVRPSQGCVDCRTSSPANGGRRDAFICWCSTHTSRHLRGGRCCPFCCQLRAYPEPHILRQSCIGSKQSGRAGQPHQRTAVQRVRPAWPGLAALCAAQDIARPCCYCRDVWKLVHAGECTESCVVPMSQIWKQHGPKWP